MQCPIVNSIFKLIQVFPVLLYHHFLSHFIFYAGVAGLSQQSLKIPPCLISSSMLIAISVFPNLSLPMKLFVQTAVDIHVHVCTCILHIFSSVFFYRVWQDSVTDTTWLSAHSREMLSFHCYDISLLSLLLHIITRILWFFLIVYVHNIHEACTVYMVSLFCLNLLMWL